MINFEKEIEARLAANGINESFRKVAHDFMISSIEPKYSYNFSWMSRPIIQLPQDIVAVQELIWKIKPDLIIETGIAHGGSVIFSASMLALIDYCEALENGELLDPHKPKRHVLGIDIDIRKHNRIEIEKHPVANRIHMIQGSSIAPDVVRQVHEYAKGNKTVMVCLDSNHTHAHVLAELNSYSSLVSINSYCIVFDTFDIPKEFLSERPWGPGNNAGTAVDEFLLTNDKFVSDKSIDNKLMISVAPRGYLKRVK
jgi:cephalosporin hydroxylase